MTWWLKHLDDSMRSWVQTWATQVHILGGVYVYIWCKEGIVGTYQPIMWQNIMLPCGIYNATMWVDSYGATC